MLKKKIDYTNPGHLKLCILSEGINVQAIKTYQKIQFAENTYQYGNGNKLDEIKSKYPAYLILADETNVGLNYNKTSPWSLTYQDKTKKLLLTYQDKIITEAWLSPQPNFYCKKLSNGQDITSVLGLYGLHCLTFFVRGWCMFINKNQACQFCSLGLARKEVGKKNVLTTTPQLAKEALKIALASDKNIVEYINYSSGTYPDFDKGIEDQYLILKEIKDILPKDKYIKQHMLTFPPANKKWIEKLFEAGLGSLNYSLEIFDRDLFAKICPGKNNFFGYDRFIQSFKEAVEIFGKGKMYVNFVGGLEPLESLLTGINYFADLGIASSINVFHPDKGTPLENHPKPSIEYLFAMVEEMHRIYKKHHFTCIYPKGGTRNSLDTEVWKGYFAN